MARVPLLPLLVAERLSLFLAMMEEATMEEATIADAPCATTFTLYIPDCANRSAIDHQAPCLQTRRQAKRS